MPVKITKKLIVAWAQYNGRQEIAKKPAKTRAITGILAASSSARRDAVRSTRFCLLTAPGIAKGSVKKTMMHVKIKQDAVRSTGKS